MKIHTPATLLVGSLLLCLCFSMCSSPNEDVALAPGEGKLPVDGGEIWYKVSGSGEGIPLVLLHGGPGYSSFYLKPFEELAAGRPVIRFDQLGSGKSDFIEDTTKFTVERFVAELEALRNHLGIEKWHVYGHSWGTMLGMAYYNAYPDQVKSLTLASPCLSSQEWGESTKALLQTLPDSLVQAVAIADSTGNFDTPGYTMAMDLFYENFVFGDRLIEEDLDSMMDTYNPAVYEYMWGPSEFSVSGTLGDFDVVNDLKKVNVPVLFTVGEFDEISSETVKEWAMRVPDSRVVIFAGSSHMTPWNAPNESIQVQRLFLDGQTIESN